MSEQNQQVQQSAANPASVSTPQAAAPAASTAAAPVQGEPSGFSPTQLDQLKGLIQETVINYMPTSGGQVKQEKLKLSPINLGNSREELAALLEEPAKFNEKLNSSMLTLFEEAFSGIPSMINNTVIQALTMAKSTERFFTDNADLVPYEGIISQTVNELHAKYPQMSVSALLNEAGRLVRAKYNIKVTAPIPGAIPAGGAANPADYATAQKPEAGKTPSLADQIESTFSNR